jgi:small redox-active disulfide protein 2
MKIEVIGSGCAKCRLLFERVKEAVKRGNINATVEYITDINEIIERGIMVSPVVLVDGEVKISGIVPPVDEIVSILKGE